MGVVATSSPARQLHVLPLRTLSDERLAELAGMGHTDAFETLYDRYRDSLARYCRSIVRDPDDAKDALQNTMLSVLNALRVNSPNGPIRPWIYRIAHNESISIIRRRRPTEQLSYETADRADTERTQLVRDRLGALLLDLRSLPDRQRGALVMRELGGLDYDEIGAALRTSPISARKAVFEARVALHDFADGRETACLEIRQRISDGDGRVLRARGVRGHLRGCASCSAFEQGLRDRRRAFALIPVFPVLSASAVLGLATGGGGGSTSGLALGGSAAGGSVLGGGGVAAVKGIALGSAIAVAGAGVLVTTGITSHLSHHRAPTHMAAVRVPRIARPRLATAPALEHVAKPARVAAVRSPGAPTHAVARSASLTTSPTTAGRRPRVTSQPNASGPSVAVPVTSSTSTPVAATQPTTPAAPTTTTPTATPTATAAAPPTTTTTPATGATATPTGPAAMVAAIIQNALQAAGANIAAAEAQAAQALSQTGVAPGNPASSVQGILNNIFHGGG